MTNIALLPGDQFAPCTIDLAEDWREPLFFLDSSGYPIALDGIDFVAPITRTVNGIANTVFTLSTDNGLLIPLLGFAFVAVVSPGTGYALGDLVSLAGGLGVSSAMLRVTGVGPSGGLASAIMTATGLYRQVPANPVAQSMSNGVGTGATFTLTWVDNALGFVVPQAAFPDAMTPGAYGFKLSASADGIIKTVATVALTAE